MLSLRCLPSSYLVTPELVFCFMIEFILNDIFVTLFLRLMSGAGSSGTGRGRGTASLTDNKTENKDTKPNPKMSKALSTSAKRYNYCTSTNNICINISCR